MAELNGNGNGKIRYYFFCTYDKKKDENVIYRSEAYRLSEYDIIDLIKALVVNKRLLGVGRKIQAMYLDSEDYSLESYNKLKEAGVELERVRIEKIKDSKVNLK